MFSALYSTYVIAILALEILVAFLIYLWWKTLKAQQDELRHASRDTYTELARIVKDTNEEAQKILAKAFTTVTKLEKDTQEETDRFRQHTSSLWNSENEWQTTLHHQLLQSYHELVTAETAKVIRELSQTLTKEAALLGDELKETIAATDTEIKQQLRQRMSEAEGQITDYQKAEIDRIHAQAQTIVKTVAGDMLTRDLTATDHHELVMNQLRKATDTFKPKNE